MAAGDSCGELQGGSSTFGVFQVDGHFSSNSAAATCNGRNIAFLYVSHPFQTLNLKMASLQHLEGACARMTEILHHQPGRATLKSEGRGELDC